MQDGLELPGTFGLDPERIRFVTPNGERFLVDGSGEDDGPAAEAAVERLAVCANDAVIAVSASGATPSPSPAPAAPMRPARASSPSSAGPARRSPPSRTRP